MSLRQNIWTWQLKCGGFGQCILHPSSSEIVSHTGTTTITLSNSLNSSASASHSSRRGARLTQLGMDSRIGSSNMRSKCQPHNLAHLLADLYQVYFSSRIHRSYWPVPLQCMDFYMLLMGLRLQDWCGWPGDLWWNTIADISNEVQYAVGNTHWQASTITSLKQLSWRWWR